MKPKKQSKEAEFPEGSILIKPLTKKVPEGIGFISKIVQTSAPELNSVVVCDDSVGRRIEIKSTEPIDKLITHSQKLKELWFKDKCKGASYTT